MAHRIKLNVRKFNKTIKKIHEILAKNKIISNFRELL